MELVLQACRSPARPAPASLAIVSCRETADIAAIGKSADAESAASMMLPWCCGTAAGIDRAAGASDRIVRRQRRIDDPRLDDRRIAAARRCFEAVAKRLAECGPASAASPRSACVCRCVERSRAGRRCRGYGRHARGVKTRIDMLDPCRDHTVRGSQVLYRLRRWSLLWTIVRCTKQGRRALRRFLRISRDRRRPSRR